MDGVGGPVSERGGDEGSQGRKEAETRQRADAPDPSAKDQPAQGGREEAEAGREQAEGPGKGGTGTGRSDE